jgi:hypothetical protein
MKLAVSGVETRAGEQAEPELAAMGGAHERHRLFRREA